MEIIKLKKCATCGRLSINSYKYCPNCLQHHRQGKPEEFKVVSLEDVEKLIDKIDTMMLQANESIDNLEKTAENIREDLKQRLKEIK